MRLPQGSGRLSGKIVRLNKSLYRLKQASRQRHAHFTKCLLKIVYVQRLADERVFRLMEEGSVVMTVVVHVDDIFAVGERARCDPVSYTHLTLPTTTLCRSRWSPYH